MDQLEMERRAKLARLCRHDCPHYLDDCGNRKCGRCDAFVRVPIPKQIEEIDRLLFDAGVMVLGAKTNIARQDADHKITEARVALEKLHARLRLATIVEAQP